jgi:hypothetical protein
VAIGGVRSAKQVEGVIGAAEFWLSSEEIESARASVVPSERCVEFRHYPRFHVAGGDGVSWYSQNYPRVPEY